MTELMEVGVESKFPQPSSYGEKEYVPPHPAVKLVLWALPRLISFIFLVVLFVWIYQAEGGIGWDEMAVFGIHALLMSLFTVTFLTEALLTYRAPLFPKNLIDSRSFHVCCHAASLCCAVLGIVAIVYYKIMSPQPVTFPFYTLYTPHSWLGVMTLLLWFIHVIGGSVLFGLKWVSEDRMPIALSAHHFFGKFIYVLSLATCAMGLQNMQSSDLAAGMIGDAGYTPYSTLAQLSSGLALLLAFLGVSVFAVFQFGGKRA